MGKYDADGTEIWTRQFGLDQGADGRVEGGGVDGAVKSCFPRWSSPGDNCLNRSLNGLLTPAGFVPEGDYLPVGAWWAFRYYAEMSGQWVSTTSSNPAMAAVAAADGAVPVGWTKASNSRRMLATSGKRSGRHDDPHNAFPLSIKKHRPVNPGRCHHDQIVFRGTAYSVARQDLPGPCHGIRTFKVEDIGPGAQVQKGRPRLPDGKGSPAEEADPGQVGLTKARLYGALLWIAKEINRKEGVVIGVPRARRSGFEGQPTRARVERRVRCLIRWYRNQ